MEIFLVGGAIRDRLLNLPVHERDWVVTGASPQQLLDLGYKPVGKDFPVFLHPETREEYALARTERKTAPGYTGFIFHTSPDVTLEEDLQRRDLTINAIAESSDGTLTDPFNGQNDLRAGLLRHVSPAFAEDPVRILRIARFAARFGEAGFHVAHATNALMRQMVKSGEVDHLVAERVWAELFKALTTNQPQKFFSVLHGCGALAILFPAIEHDFVTGQNTHGNSTENLALEALKNIAGNSKDSRIRFAGLMRALNPGNTHEQRLQTVKELCHRYKVPNEYRQLAELCIQLENKVTASDAETRLLVLESANAFRNPDRWQLVLHMLVVCELVSDDEADLWQEHCTNACAVKSEPLLQQGLQGKQLGRAIRTERLAAIKNTASGNAD